MLDPRQTELIQKSFAEASAHPHEVIRFLFESLFRRDPSLRFLFPEDLTDLIRRFGFMLGHVVHRLNQWDDLAPRIRNLGVRHATYGVKASHYKTFGEALMETLQKYLHVEPHSECARAWASLYEQVSSAMIEAPEATECCQLVPKPA